MSSTISKKYNKKRVQSAINEYNLVLQLYNDKLYMQEKIHSWLYLCDIRVLLKRTDDENIDNGITLFREYRDGFSQNLYS